MNYPKANISCNVGVHKEEHLMVIQMVLVLREDTQKDYLH